ncbi:hypothetical protein AB0K00_33310 [Dactylosporangium sp. NPDC049525]|uniref:hypothetical protein n=1 Tax=Dactylosporangium sp. NPDC049525 TaxID=3154730 RepID=UPI003445388B
MTGPCNTYVKAHTWVGQRPYPLADLYALRAAGLVRATSTIQESRSYRRFEVTERGMAEASRLSDGTPGRQEELQR